ncbi:30S ribosomal protein S20 [Candidatus Daviesbacteria bacterium]|nr:30S ribosomal protein S20 [Candidatus Daviesbacteria bacterium]
MPIIRSSIKKMRQDKKKTAHNKLIKENIKQLVKKMRQAPSTAFFNQLSSTLDKAVKTKLIHANKASRFKSRLSKLIQTKPTSAKKAPALKPAKK